MSDNISALRAELDYRNEEILCLREELRALKAENLALSPPPDWGFTSSENALFCALLSARGRFCTYDMLRRALPRRGAEFTSNSNIQVVILRIRRKIAARGITIRNYRDVGYYMENRGAIRELMLRLAAAND